MFQGNHIEYLKVTIEASHLVVIATNCQEVCAKVHGLDVECRHDDLLVCQGWLRLFRQLKDYTN